MAWYWVVLLTLAAELLIVALVLLASPIRHGWWRPLHGARCCWPPDDQWSPVSRCEHGNVLVRKYLTKIPGMVSVLRRILRDSPASGVTDEET